MDKLKQMWASVKEYLSNLSDVQKIVLFIAVIILICFFTSCNDACKAGNGGVDTAVVETVDTVAVDTTK